MPKVSVCIPTYNRPALFRATLRSVLRQSFTDFEIIVSDNASEEDISGVIAEVADPRIRFYRQRQNLGSAANFRFLQTLPIGEYILFLCSDDLLLPNCLEKAVNTLDRNPTRGGVIYMGAHYDEHGFEFLSTMPTIEYADADIYRENQEVINFRFTSPSVCLYRRTTFEHIGGWDTELLAVTDWEMYSRMIRKGVGICFLHEVLAIMRLHDNRHSNTTAMHWDFFHDVLIISSRPETRGTAFVEARAVSEQLLWDLRLKRRPWATLRHTWRYGAMKSFVMLLPYEITRRFLIKIAILVRWPKRADVPPPTSLLARAFDREATDAFWKDMTQENCVQSK